MKEWHKFGKVSLLKINCMDWVEDTLFVWLKNFISTTQVTGKMDYKKGMEEEIITEKQMKVYSNKK